MDLQRVYILLEEADKMVQTAEEEMMRAEEDAVTHSVCFNSRQAIINYLTVFLLNKGIGPASPPTMAALFDQCRSVDSRFDLLSIENLHCRFEAKHEEYCLSVSQVDECLQIARQASKIVKGKTSDS